MHKITSLTLVALFSVGMLGLPMAAIAARDDIRTEPVTQLNSNITGGRAVTVFDQPIDEVLAVVVDYANYKTFMPNFRKSRVLAQRGSRAMVYMEVGVMKDTFTLWGQLKMSEARPEGGARIIEAALVEGNIDAFEARWTLTPVEGGKRTQVDFQLFVDPDMPLPASVFSRENLNAARKSVRALQSRLGARAGT
jgi:ribosome-associated toxin RatA of RatAB toxin-antitoxin module